MAMITYVNGRYLPHAWAAVAVDDRGYQFADGVYEVIAFFNRRLLDGEGHLQRLTDSLEKLEIPLPMSVAAMQQVIDEIISRSHRVNGNIYLQITRGAARRDHQFPSLVVPSLVVSAFARKIPSPAMLEDGVRVVLHPDERWARPDIKSISVLPNILAKQQAVEAGAFEAWLVRQQDGVITESSHSNSYMVDADGTVVTHPQSAEILSGITRATILSLARDAGIKVEERPFTVNELRQASEAFLSNTTSGILPVTQVDEWKLGDGKTGMVTRKLLSLYHDYIFRQTGYRL